MDSYLSDGEISNDTEKDDRLEEISSEEEWFNNLNKELEKRKTELELENELYSFDDYAKENRSYNHSRSSRPAATSSRRRKPSVTKKSEIRHRSFRASSVFSNYSSMPKRKRSSRTTSQKKSRKHSRYSKVSGAISSENEEEGQKESSDDDDECELIALRLNALKSKQEFKEPEVPEVPLVSEEELLRIDALKSALIKKKAHFKEKKLKKKMENERPYSPTDNLDPMLYHDDPMELETSPIHSPFNQDDDTNQMDMEISNSSPEGAATPVEEQINGEKDLSDMEIASSPVERVNEEIENEAESMEEEKALRSLLLSSITMRKKAEETNVAKNLKMAVERLRQAHPPTIQVPKKSGTKTIKMILDEKKSKKIEKPPEFEEQIKTEQNLLLNKIMEQSQVIEKLPTPEKLPTENDALLSTISDTKNIPLRSTEEGTKKSRVITSLDQMKRIVEPLIIKVNADSTDDESKSSRIDRGSAGRMIKKTHRKIIRVDNNLNSLPKSTNPPQVDVIEKQVETILRRIRIDSDKKASQMEIKPSPNEPPKIKEPLKPVSSAVSHLPRSQQIEYAMLKEKMEKLEEERISRHKTKQLKRQKSIQLPKIPTKVEVPVKQEEPKSIPAQKVEDTITKIRMLDEGARERFTINAENKYLAHSQGLKDSVEEVMKNINFSSYEIKRRDHIDTKIAELEKQLAKYKTSKKVVENRIHTSIPQIVRSQNALIKIRNHQHNFGSMCSRVGEIVRGPNYRLPTGTTEEVYSSMSSIVEKSEEIANICKDHFAIKHLKANVEKIREFIETAKEKESVPPLVPEYSTEKRVLVDEGSAQGNAAKMAKYESPLEFLKAPADGDEETDNNLNRVVCPFALDGTCKDANCKMLHL